VTRLSSSGQLDPAHGQLGPAVREERRVQRRQIEAQQVVASHHQQVLVAQRNLRQREGDVAGGAQLVGVVAGAVVQHANRHRARHGARPSS